MLNVCFQIAILLYILPLVGEALAASASIFLFCIAKSGMLVNFGLGHARE